MRKIISLFTVMVLCFSMVGCGVNREKHPLALYKDSKIVAEIGMERKEVEKKLGKAIDQTTSVYEYSQVKVDIDEYEELTIIYTNDYVDRMVVSNKEYHDFDGRSPGDTADENIIVSRFFDNDLNIVEMPENISAEKRKQIASYRLVYGIENNTIQKIIIKTGAI